MRPRTGLWLASLLVLGCAQDEQSGLAAEQRASVDAPAKPSSSARDITPAPTEVREPMLELGAGIEAAPELGGETESMPAPDPEVEVEPEPEDSLAPILPSAPEPGSPEADAELAELLEESTITQEEFDRAFRGGGPAVHGDELVFGPNARTRDRPLLSVGTPKVSASSVDAASLKKLAEASQQELLACHAMSLSKDPKATGALVLRLTFDQAGAVSSATIEAGSALGSSLRACLISVAEDWSLAAAAGAEVGIPLTLSSEPASNSSG